MNPTLPNLPAGIREDDLIDLVDGRLSREREGVVLGAIRDEPGLATLVKAMRLDVAGAKSLDRVRAPAGLAEGIEARLEAAALNDLAAASRATSDAIPISSVEVRGPGWAELLMERVWPRRLAMAASLAIVAGLGVWGVRSMTPKGSKPGPVEIAHKETTNPTPVAPTPSMPESAPIDLAQIDPASTTDFGPIPTVVAEPARSVAMSDARAAELARDGRLAITIHATIAQNAMKKLDALVKAGGREGWKSVPMDNVPAEYAMLKTPSWTLPNAPGVPMVAPNSVASNVPGAGNPTTTAPRPSPAMVVRAIYTVDVNPGEKGLSALVRTITDALPEGAVVELRETPRIADAPLPLDPDSVLWWNAAPAKWARRATVPITVEGLE